MPRPFHRPTAGAFLLWPHQFGGLAQRLDNRQGVPRPIKWWHFSKVTSGRLLHAGAMAEETNKSKRYLRWAAANEQRAARAYNEEVKTLFLRIAAQYRDLAEQIDDPQQWRTKRRGRQN
jgi:hypothetical protein